MRLHHPVKSKMLPEIVLFLVIAAVGILYIRSTWNRIERDQSENVLLIARSIETALPRKELNQLDARPGDIDKPEYQVIKNTLKSIIRVNTNARFAYIYKERDGKIYFIADSEPVDSKDYSPPGQEYSEAKAQDKQPFADGKESVTRPLIDRWGRWVSVFIPIKDETTGKTVAVFGLDFNAESWHRAFLFEVIQSSVLVLLLLVASLFLFHIIVNNRLLNYEIRERKKADEALLMGQDRARIQRNTIARIAVDETISFGSLADSIKSLTEEISLAMNIERASIWLFSDNNTLLECKALFEKETRRHSSGTLLKCEDYPRYFEALHHESRINAGDAQNDPRTSEFSAGYLQPLGISSMLDAGIYVEGELKGVVCLEHIGEKRTWHSDEESFSSTIASIVAQSITNHKRKQAEEELLDKERQFKEVMNQLPNSVLIHQNGKIVYANKVALDIIGYTEEEFLNTDVLSHIVEKDRKLLVEMMQRRMAGFPAVDYEIAVLTKSGHLRDAIIRTTEIQVFGEPSVVVLLIDITERKAAEGLLRESEEKFRNLAVLTPFAIMIYQNDVWVYANPAGSVISGYSEEELYAMHFWDIVAPEYRSLVQERGQKRQTGEQVPTGYEFQIIAKDGTKKWVFLNGSRIEYHGKPAGLIAIIDISNLKQIERDLIIAKEQAQESDRLKSAFLAKISHEIRTPMNGILGFAALLKEPGLTGDEQQEYISIIEQSGERMLNIITDIVDISRIESERIEVSISDTNIHGQIEDIYNFFKPEIDIKENGISFIKSLPPREIIIKTDREKVYKILAKLVRNAIKYTTRGSIEIGYRLKTGGSPSEIEFFVKDTGNGIPAHRHKAIFERFIQAEIIDKKALQGAGLGLSISKAYVEKLGGRIWLESEEGKGSAFYFTIPYHPEAEARPILKEVIPEENKAGEIRKLKILIAEDDATSDLLITAMLRKISHEILHAFNGEEAVETCRNHPDLNLVLMDIRMPKLDGYEATRQIRLFNQEVIIVAQTAYVLAGDREKAMEAGCNGYLSKPVIKDQLLGLVQKYLSK